MPQRTQRRFSLLAVAAVVVAIGLDLAVLAPCLSVLRSSSYLPVQFEASQGACPWRAGPTATSFGHQMGETIPGGACLEAVAGIPVEQVTLVRDPGYLITSAEYRAWLVAQARLFEQLSRADQTTLTLTTDRGKTLHLEVPVSRFSWRKVHLAAWATLFTAIATVVFGCVVFLRRPEHAASRLLMAFSHGMYVCAVVATTFVTRGIGPATRETELAYWANGVAFHEAAAMLMLLTVYFPKPWFSRRGGRLLLALTALWGVSSFFLPCFGLAFGSSMMLAASVEVVVALIMVVCTQFRSLAQIQRAQGGWVLWGLATPSLLWAVTRVPYLLGVTHEPPPTDEILFLFATTIPVGLGVAILRYRLLDIGIIVRRTAVGTAVVALLLLAHFVLFSALATDMAGDSISSSDRAVVVVVAILLTFAVMPTQSRLQEVTDRLLFRDRSHYRQLLTRTPDDLADLHHPRDVAETVLRQTCTTMELPRMVIALPPGAPPPRPLAPPGPRAGAAQRKTSLSATRIRGLVAGAAKSRIRKPV